MGTDSDAEGWPGAPAFHVTFDRMAGIPPRYEASLGTTDLARVLG